MSNLRPYPLGNEHNAFFNNVGSVVNSHALTAGSGISLLKTANGTQISVNNSREINYTHNKGVYDFNAEYFVGDIVYVNPNVTYQDQNSSSLHLSAGGYVCINYVPPANNASSFFLTNIVPAYQDAGGYPNDDMANNYRWYQYNNYYPITNFPATMVYISTLDASGFNIVTSQSFWQPIGGSGGVGGWNWRNEYNPSSSYSTNDVTIVSPTNGVSTTGVYLSSSVASGLTGSAALGYSMPGTYLCLQAASPYVIPSGSLISQSCYNIPLQPAPTSNQYFQMLEPYPAQHYAITSLVQQDYYVATQWDGGGTGSVLIRKNPRGGMMVASETYFGTQITFAYSNDNLRIATDPVGNTEIQSIFPLFQAGFSGSSSPSDKCIVTAYVPFNTNGSNSGSAPIFLEEMLPARVWSRVYYN